MKNTFYKVSYLTLCLLIATPHALRAENSGWKFWLGVGAACLGGAAIAASFIEDDPETLIENAQKTFRSEKSTYKRLARCFNQGSNSDKLQYLNSFGFSFHKTTDSLSRLFKAADQAGKASSLLSKKINKVKRTSDYFKVEALERRMKDANRLREKINHYIFHKLWPIAFGYRFLELDRLYNALYKECAFEGSVELYVQRHYGNSMYPYCTYNNQITKSLNRVKSIISDWESFRITIHDAELPKTNYEWFCFLNDKINYFIGHAQQLRTALHNTQAIVTSSTQYQAEQYRQEMERMRLENERIQRQQQREIDRLKNQVNNLEWERYTAPVCQPVYVDVNVKI
jgi:hypothetical protein